MWKRAVKIIDTIVVALMAICVVAGSVLAYWWVFDTSFPADYVDPPNHFETAEGVPISTVHPGQYVYLSQTVCVSLNDPKKLDHTVLKGKQTRFTGNGSIRGVTSSRFVDGYIVLLPDQMFDIDPGCYKLKRSVKIPKGLPSGPFRYKETVEVFRNPLQAMAGGVVKEVANIPIEVEAP